METDRSGADRDRRALVLDRLPVSADREAASGEDASAERVHARTREVVGRVQLGAPERLVLGMEELVGAVREAVRRQVLPVDDRRAERLVVELVEQGVRRDEPLAERQGGSRAGSEV